MAEILELGGLTDPKAAHAVEILERGGVVLLPGTPFEISQDEAGLIDPAVLNRKSKNVSYDAATAILGGSILTGAGLAAMTGMVRRYSMLADEILAALTPGYGPHLQKKRTSFRPGAIETRALSPRKDDKRLHVDAFPSSPMQGRRIFRVFTNADPAGAARVWNLGDQDFTTFAQAFRSKIRPTIAGAWRERIGLTKGRRTAYDAIMLQLHDAAKFDDDWQQHTPRARIAFPPGSSWVVYTDSVLHAALSGQHAFEQTYLMPVGGMADERRSPLRVLERVTGRPLL